jgi:galactose-1-phosphate uridylyltransferase
MYTEAEFFKVFHHNGMVLFPSSQYQLQSQLQIAILRLPEQIIRSWFMYNASDVKIYNATSSLVRFENKNIVFYFE